MPKIPRQSEVNIGTAGHVDHGKCLSLDETILFNGRLMKGYELKELAEIEGKLLTLQDRSENYLVYQLVESNVKSLNQELKLSDSEAYVYLQPYDGKIIQICTASGRKISVTLEHPLLVNRQGVLNWVKAIKLNVGDYIAIARKLELNSHGLKLPDVMENIRKYYQIITYGEYLDLKERTDDFRRIDGLTIQDLEKIRALLKMSKRELSRSLKLSYDLILKIFKGERVFTKDIKERFIKLLKIIPPITLKKDEFLIVYKRKSGTQYRILKDVKAIDEDMVKWFAFIWSEGASSRGRIAIAQKEQETMLNQMLKITKQKFGVKFKHVRRIGYHLNCKPLVDYLKLKFGFRAGNKNASPILPWITGLRHEYKSTFLRWFFTLDGEFNPKTGQISIVQANQDNIIILSYLLLEFGIVSRFGTKFDKARCKEYYRLSISGRDNLAKFLNHIGFEDEKKDSLIEYLRRVSTKSKETDFSIPINHDEISRVCSLIGLRREHFTRSKNDFYMKKSSWYKSYEACKRTHVMSYRKLRELLLDLELQTNRVEHSLHELTSEPNRLKKHAFLLGLSQEKLARTLGISRKSLAKALTLNDQTVMRSIFEFLASYTHSALISTKAFAKSIRTILEADILFDRISEIKVLDYKGYVIDLATPRFANFIAGNGAIVCHNTTLVEAITGIWASAHSEELKRGITIKVGYADAAFYKCPSCLPPMNYSTSPKCPNCGSQTELLRVVSFVDCPGHEALMTNMLSGAAVMDGAILVIAANEKVPQPQTREHLLALQMLGLRHIVIAQNKVDLVSYEEALSNYEKIKSFIADTTVKDAPIIPISAQHKLNIDAMIEAVEKYIPTPKRNPDALPIMHVLRSFDINRPGASIDELKGGVVGGTLLQGEIKLDDEVELRPGILNERTSKYEPIFTSVASLGTSAGLVDKVKPGGLIAVGTKLDPYMTKGDALVGQVLGKPGSLPPIHEEISLSVALFEVAVGAPELIKVERIKMNESLRLNVGTAVTLGTVSSIKGDRISIKLKRPICATTKSRVAISRRIVDRWRLIGSGIIE